MKKKEEVLELIRRRTHQKRCTMPDIIQRELRLRDKELEYILRELHRERAISLKEGGWMAG